MLDHSAVPVSSHKSPFSASQIDEIKRRKTDISEDEEEEDEEPVQSSKELLDIVNGMRRFVQKSGKGNLLTCFKQLENEIHLALHESKQQITIDQMFSKLNGSPSKLLCMSVVLFS